MPFNGPDVPGFGGHADKDLAVAWYKAGFLFPFLRNHACAGTADQSPGPSAPRRWTPSATMCACATAALPGPAVGGAEAQGAAVMRPLFYDFADTDGLNWIAWTTSS